MANPEVKCRTEGKGEVVEVGEPLINIIKTVC